MFTNFLTHGKKMQSGDFVMLKKQYKTIYPGVPTRMALKIEEIQQEEATVVFINYEANKICRAKVSVSALSNAL
jgi:hypothetical protein